MKHIMYLLFSMTFLTLSVNGIASTENESADALRQQLKDSSRAALEHLFGENPSARAEVKSAFGYAVFTNHGLNQATSAAEMGGGIVHNNRRDKDLFMKMVSAGSDLGNGGSEFSIVLIFENGRALENFKDVAWDISGQINSADDSPLTGDGVSGAASILPGTTVYQLTENGLVSNPSLAGIKFVMDEKLN